MNEIVNLISNIGFPIFAFILMYKMNSETISKVNEAIQHLTVSVEKLTTLIERSDENE